MPENPFIKKAQERKHQRRVLAEQNRNALLDLLNRYTDKDNPEARERIRQRVVEAQEAVDAC